MAEPDDLSPGEVIDYLVPAPAELDGKGVTAEMHEYLMKKLSIRLDRAKYGGTEKKPMAWATWFQVVWKCKGRNEWKKKLGSLGAPEAIVSGGSGQAKDFGTIVCGWFMRTGRLPVAGKCGALQIIPLADIPVWA